MVFVIVEARREVAEKPGRGKLFRTVKTYLDLNDAKSFRESRLDCGFGRG